jgi:hypothetical protein
MVEEVPTWLKKFSNLEQKKQTAKHRDRSENESYSDPKDVIDFMSDSLITVPVPDSFSSLPSRKHSKPKTRPLKEVMDDAVAQGLVKPLDKDNIGFKMVSTLDQSGLFYLGIGILIAS